MKRKKRTKAAHETTAHAHVQARADLAAAEAKLADVYATVRAVYARTRGDEAGCALLAAVPEAFAGVTASGPKATKVDVPLAYDPTKKYEHKGLSCDAHDLQAHRRERNVLGPWTCTVCAPVPEGDG